ncbi:FkbM family methyltransferase [Pseudohoeflea suaedae]|uniref:FkbM family methyltransferase n=1 Tax=Pseudohoeflea suaedae TaxID=877384 RepID=A0A4R5PJ77_9HYPH|nr:FkbM family methyltransferase [Pseudohoeflea suaedae]TDH34924.1 FkbM family methyltransferase [Pseudohoeflea suaedae]
MRRTLSRFDVAYGVLRSLVVYYGQPWRRIALKRFYRDLISPGDLVFDIGAHVGSRSHTLLSLGARVVAVEPQPVLADLVRRHIGGRLTALEEKAVSDSEGEIELVISSRNPTVTSTSRQFIETVGSIDSFKSVVWDRKITVPVTTLDALVARYGMPAFCKIDVEGAELDILNGLSSPIPLVAFEYIPAMATTAVGCIDRLMEIGDYRFNRVLGERHRLVADSWLTAVEMKRFISELTPDETSGDIYARLESLT